MVAIICCPRSTTIGSCITSISHSTKLIRWDLAEADINDTGATLIYEDGKWHFTRNGVKYYDAPTKEMLIEAWCNHDMQDYTCLDDLSN